MSACVTYLDYCIGSDSCPFPPNSIDDGARGIVEMLFCTSLIALVGAADQPSSSPRKLQIVNTKVRTTASVVLLFSPPNRHVAATIHDLRALVPFLNSSRQNEPKDARHRSRNRDLHI